MALVTVAVLGGPFARWREQARTVTRYAVGSIHVLSVAAAIAAGWAVAVGIPDQALAYLAASATAVLLYQAVLGAEIALAEVEDDDDHSAV
jgi:hypothetical protein